MPLPPLPAVHLLTCPPRAASLAATLARWDATDWGTLHGRPRVHVDAAADAPRWGEAGRAAPMLAAFAAMVRAAIEEEFTAEAQRAQSEEENQSSPSPRPPRLCGEDWLLFLEDDVAFHPWLAALVASWPALADPACGMASLFNPSLRGLPIEGIGRPAAPAPSSNPQSAIGNRQFRCDPRSFLGTQALLLRRSFAAHAMARWDDPAAAGNGLQSQRLARLYGERGGRPLYVHRPSLVQHVAIESGWGARIATAPDFDPAWVPPEDG